MASAVGRVLDDGSTQLWLSSYDTTGFFNLTQSVDPLGQKTTWQYDGSHNLSTVTNANNQTAATYTYDAFARVRTYTDSEGWTVTYDYDAADRVTRRTYPDGTTETYTYDRLDLVANTG